MSSRTLEYAWSDARPQAAGAFLMPWFQALLTAAPAASNGAATISPDVFDALPPVLGGGLREAQHSGLNQVRIVRTSHLIKFGGNGRQTNNK